ncbi:hypothetical protein Tsp_03547 [Trichinella spiralis]|uniref:hypothetical protein n=1 Tax=Trichinella spiralis TaxID=6334 RepID=UPI0001EFB62D|nr:hypothetical protein Tsp_03547 [Trichinella spiralis]
MNYDSIFQFHINALSQPTVRQHPLNHKPRKRVHSSITKLCMHFLADGVVQHQNKRRFQRKPDKQHHLYSVWSITLCNSSKNVYLQMMGVFVASPLHYLTFTKHTCICRSEEYVYANVNEGEHCRWHFATCTLCHPNPERTALLFNYSLLRNVLITHCIALFGHFGASLQQIR